MPIRNLTDANPDGWNIGQSPTDKIGFYGAPPIMQKGNPYQGPVGPQPMGEIVNFFTTQSPSAIAANTTAERTFTIAGLLATDFVLAVSMPMSQAGLGICGARVDSSGGSLHVTFSNDTANPITPTATKVYNVVVLRGFPTISAALTPTAVPGGTSVEQQFSIAPTPPVATSNINAAGQVTGVNFTSNGSGYVVPPTVVFAGGGPNPSDVQTGTFLGLDDPPATAAMPYGSGAAGIAILNSAGNVVGVQITHGGAGYQVAPAVSFVGGVCIPRGFLLAVNKPTLDAGIGIGGCRVVSDNVIAVTYFNNTTGPLTPTAQTYMLIALSSLIPISKTFVANINVGTVSSAATISTTEASFALNGALATDVITGVQKPTFQTGLMIGNGRVPSGGNYVNVPYVNPTAGGITPTANEIYSVAIFRQTPGLPLAFFMLQLSPQSVALGTTAEQSFTVPAGLVTYINSVSGSVFVNKPSQQAGLAIVGCRVISGTSIGITFQNNTGSAITPTPGEIYICGATDQVPTGTEAASYTPFTQEAASFMYQQQIALLNELEQVAAVSGLINGG
jgi:hypothetical protein